MPGSSIDIHRPSNSRDKDCSEMSKGQLTGPGQRLERREPSSSTRRHRPWHLRRVPNVRSGLDRCQYPLEEYPRLVSSVSRASLTIGGRSKANTYPRSGIFNTLEDPVDCSITSTDKNVESHIGQGVAPLQNGSRGNGGDVDHLDGDSLDTRKIERGILTWTEFKKVRQEFKTISVFAPPDLRLPMTSSGHQASMAHGRIRSTTEWA